MSRELARRLLVRPSQPESVQARFLLELLAAEGLTGFEWVDLDAGSVPESGPGDLLVVSRCRLRNEEIDALAAAADHGAALLLLQPSANLAARFGWRDTATAAYPGWIDIRPGLPGHGTPLQTHVPIVGAAPEEPDAWDILAEAADADWRAVGFPAAAVRRAGPRVALWFFDPAKAVHRLRFGNPDLADVTTTGHWHWTHALDLFVGHLDPRVAHLPQADFHGQLLAEAATRLAPHPLARLWYYEAPEQRTGVVFQSDDDHSAPEHFDALIGTLERCGGRGTFYLMETTYLADEKVAAWWSAGHTFGPHLNVFREKGQRPIELWFDYPAETARQTALFEARYGRRSATQQSHCAPWCGMMDFVPLYQEHGYRLLFAYLSGPRPLINRFLCGSGRPIRFHDLDGTAHDVWQQPLPTYDDASLAERIGTEPEAVFAEFAEVFDDAVARTHTAFAILSHPISFYTYSRPFIERCFEHVQAAGIPIVTADQWLEFHDRRRAAVVRQRADGEIVLRGLRGGVVVMWPCERAPEVAVDGRPAEVVVDQRLGRRWAMVRVEGDQPERDLVVTVRGEPNGR